MVEGPYNTESAVLEANLEYLPKCHIYEYLLTFIEPLIEKFLESTSQGGSFQIKKGLIP